MRKLKKTKKKTSMELKSETKTKTETTTDRRKPSLFNDLDPEPNLCRTCLGDSGVPFKLEGEKDCKICSRTFTVATWETYHNGVRRLEVCYSCSELHNVCQLCNEECRRSQGGGFLPIKVTEEIVPPKIDSLPRPPRGLLKLRFYRREADDGLGCCHSGRLEYCRVCLMDRRRERREMRT
ncbi:hypothetical protein ACHQM5_006118 [Ranunculus cassubicifolius]